jgi:hypothetical protein
MARARGAALCAFALAALFAGPAAATRGALPHDLTVFTVASDVQFINTADDRARGAINNPFDAATNKLKPKTPGGGDGPFPGDIVVFNFDLYGKLPVKKKIGAASYTCYFNYTRHALCQAYYQLHNGTLTASGPVDFNATSFKLVITGGTNAYLAARGQVSSNKSADNSQRVDFRLLG